MRPSDIQVIGDHFAIKWSDGSETFLPQELLRRACPCAACGGEPDVLGHVVRPQVTHTPASFRLKGWQPVGSYALQITWEDGHSTGLYSFDYLKRLDAAAAGAGGE
ncbi:MAG TPA: DUF971 domain-containing protein [Chthoniobacteraceae bacterium]|nr:DUF971 domain-containing protein [Chthoniobacteraceae bacterium]